MIVDMTIKCLPGSTSRWNMIKHQTRQFGKTLTCKFIDKYSGWYEHDGQAEFDENPFLTSKKGDYVLRDNPPGKISLDELEIHGKYIPWWKGPFEIVHIVNTEYCSNQKHYTPFNLVSQRKYKAVIV